MNRRFALTLIGGAALAATGLASATGPASGAGRGSAAGLASAAPQVTVFRNPSCGCCTAWVDHLRANGFTVTVDEVPDTALPRRLAGIPDHLASCHTARVDGYSIEGHVPAADIRRLLAQRPDAVGLAVPGMPAGSPGMEMPDGRVDRYEVLLVDRTGGTRTWSRHGGR